MVFEFISIIVSRIKNPERLVGHLGAIVTVFFCTKLCQIQRHLIREMLIFQLMYTLVCDILKCYCNKLQ